MLTLPDDYITDAAEFKCVCLASHTQAVLPGDQVLLISAHGRAISTVCCCSQPSETCAQQRVEASCKPACSATYELCRRVSTREAERGSVEAFYSISLLELCLGNTGALQNGDLVLWLSTLHV